MVLYSLNGRPGGLMLTLIRLALVLEFDFSGG